MLAGAWLQLGCSGGSEHGSDSYDSIGANTATDGMGPGGVAGPNTSTGGGSVAGGMTSGTEGVGGSGGPTGAGGNSTMGSTDAGGGSAAPTGAGGSATMGGTDGGGDAGPTGAGGSTTGSSNDGVGGSDGPTGAGGSATMGGAGGAANTGGAGGVSGTTASGGSGGSNTGCEASGFYVQDGKIHDVNCNEFVLRGVNYPYAWFAQSTQSRFGDIAAVGSNAVRVVVATGGQWTRTSGSEVSNIISWAKANQLVAMLEVHDSTGYGDSNAAVHPDNAVEYWLSNDIRSAIVGQEAYVMINIANEPFGNDATNQWQSFHSGAVQSLRSGGIGHLLVVDAPNWGQDWTNTMRDGNGASAIFDADPNRNVAFSVHMYDVYDSANVVQSYFSNFLAKGLPLIIGEFAADHGSSGNVDEAAIMAQAVSRGVGYLGWSWSGNSSDLQSLDITNNFNVDSLTNWGNTLIYGSDGIANTSEICSCFQ